MQTSASHFKCMSEHARPMKPHCTGPWAGTGVAVTALASFSTTHNSSLLAAGLADGTVATLLVQYKLARWLPASPFPILVAVRYTSVVP